jgi:ankyrin repeat protein
LGADIHVNNEFLLFTACERGLVDVVIFLLQNGANASAVFDHVVECLDDDDHNGLKIIELLIENGGDPSQNESLSLVLAIHYGNYGIAKILLKHGADPSHLKMGDLLGVCHNLEMVDILSDSGADFTLLNDYFSYYKPKPIISKLMNLGVNAECLAHIFCPLGKN